MAFLRRIPKVVIWPPYSHAYTPLYTQMPNKKEKELGSIDCKIITQIQKWEKNSFEYNWTDS